MPNYDKLTKKEALELWKQHCETVQTATVIGTGETNAQREQRIKRVRADYAAFVDYYFPHYTQNPQTGVQTPCAPFHIKAANKVKSEKTCVRSSGGTVAPQNPHTWTYLSPCG